jgi:flagellar basal body-associated protein FliL
MLKIIIVDIIVLALVALAVIKFLQRDEQEHEQKRSQE